MEAFPDVIAILKPRAVKVYDHTIEKHRPGQQDSRNAKRYFEKEGFNHQTNARDSLVISAARRLERTVIRDESKGHATSNVPEMPSREDYVQQWLAQVMHEKQLLLTTEPDYGKINVSRPVDPEGPSRGLDFNSFLQGQDFDLERERKDLKKNSRKRILKSSSSCSLLDYALTTDPLSKTSSSDNAAELIKIDESSKKCQNCRKLERSISFDGNIVSVSMESKVKSFERRKRHKTHEDHYKPKTLLVDPKPQAKRQIKREKKNKSRLRRIIPRNGEDLMYQFSSNSVGPNRLTMRPSRAGGLFQNGRTSSPTRRRGLPDLAFSEMGFLTRSKQQPPKMEQDRYLSKSQERERRRSERAQNEISEYFKSSGVLPIGVEQADTNRKSHMSKSDQNFHQGSPKQTIPSICSNLISQSVDRTKELCQKPDQQHTFENLGATQEPTERTEQPEIALDRSRNLSDGVTSYYTWSESTKSPQISQSIQNIHSEISTTPESIRKKLNDTGIFAYTRLDRRIIQSREAAKKSLVEELETIPSIKGCDEPKVGCTGVAVSKEGVKEELDRSPKTIVQHYNPESRREKHPASAEENMHYHILEAKVPQLETSRQIIAEESYINVPLTIRPEMPGAGVDRKPKFSSNEPESEISKYHQPQMEHLRYEEINTLEAQNSLHVCDKETKRRGATLSTHIHVGESPTAVCCQHESATQFSKPTTLDMQSELQSRARLEACEVQHPSISLDNMPDSLMTDPQAKITTDQTCGGNTEGHVHSHRYTPVQLSRGLPIRGLRSSRAGMRVSSSRIVLPPVIIQPLYSRQLENIVLHDLTDANVENGYQGNLQLNRFDDPWRNSSCNDDGEFYDRLKSEHDFLGSAADLLEYDEILLDHSNFEAHSIHEEQEYQPEKLYYEDTTPLAPAQQYSFQTAQYISSVNEHYLPVLEADLDWKSYDFASLGTHARDLVQSETCGVHPELKRFWQPRRQY